MAATWPDSTSYSSAVQTPAHTFSDPALQRSRFVPGVMGMPKVRSGQFAQVYELVDGATTYAVKCFSTPFADRQRRYAAISATLTQLADPAFVEFHFLPSGILIGDQWFPIVKMAWAGGDLLDQFIERSLGDAASLRAVADRWRETMLRLEAAGIAHGDLQSGNVKIDAGQVKLIDYDGLYVPALAGEPSGELGLPDFQHPRRTGSAWDASIDRFSALVIDLTLRALAAEPALWSAFHSDPNFLILQRTDFQDPDATAIWNRLKTSPDPEVAAQTRVLAACCRIPIGAVPPIAVLFGPNAAVDPEALVAQYATPVPGAGAPEASVRWWEQQNLPTGEELERLQPVAVSSAASTAPDAVFNPDFIPDSDLDQLQQDDPVQQPVSGSGTATSRDWGSTGFWLVVLLVIALLLWARLN